MAFSDWEALLRNVAGGEEKGQPKEPPRSGEGARFFRHWVLPLGGLFVLFILANIAKEIYTEYLWYDSLGFSGVYLLRIITQVSLFVAGFVALFLLALGNIFLVRRLAPLERQFYVMGVELVGPIKRLVTVTLLLGAFFLSLIFASIVGGQWDAVLRFLNVQPFGATEPLFNQEIAFYVFQLPIYRFIQMWLAGAFIIIFLACLFLYAFNFSLQQFSFAFTPAIKGHLSALGVVIMLLFGVGYLLDTYDLVYSSTGVVFGAGFSDATAQLLALRLQMAMAVISAIFLLVNVFRRGVGLPALGISLWIGTAILVGGIYPAVVQRFSVQPNELAMETPYIKNNIALTRQAYGLNRIETRDFPAEKAVTPAALTKNPGTMNNIRLWDPRPLRDTFNQVQSIRLYYDFTDVDVDRYVIDGRYRQVMLSARELSPEKLAERAQTWVNRRLQFTHGYGAVVNPVTEVDTGGQPQLFVKDIPPMGKIDIKRPEIYYGEKTTDYVIVNTKSQEFDYPMGDSNVYTRYQGTSGVRLSSYFRRILYAWQFGDINILLNTDLTPESSILYYRNIHERVRHVAPFLKLDRDPYLVILDGQLYWIQDAYTVTDRYPYSEPLKHPRFGSINYIRNSVKVVISAYDGSMRFYVMDPSDGLIAAYQAIYPALFEDKEEMPPALAAHVRYPEDLFLIQGEMFRTYHMEDPQVFYNREDLWDFPTNLYLGAEEPMEPYYIIMHLPGGGGEEFIIMLPFTPVNKKNTIAWMAARSDGDKYGSLLAFIFPKDRLIYGPMQIEARINQDATIAEQFGLWNRSGAEIIRGNLLMIPLENSSLYVEPIYLQSAQSRLPELKKIIVANGDNIAMGDTLAQSLALVMGAGSPPVVSGPPPTTPSPVSVDVKALIQAAQDHYNRAQDYLKQGDWTGFGQELKAMADALNQLAKAAK
ncbi:MAG: UPF0182 family protein [Chloroflexi bacterium]|nr:UPF0182 family protein [Chloroflexota bacterium]